MAGIAGLRREIYAELKRLADPGRAEEERRYFKETIRPLGVPVPECRKVASRIWTKSGLDYGTAVALAGTLLRGYWEEGLVALDLIHRTRKDWDEGTFDIFEKWLGKEVTNWAHCDELSNHSVNYLVERYPELGGRRLIAWTGSRNRRWLRRAAAVSLVPSARKGRLMPLAFRVAGRLLADEDDMVRKGVGWLLKEAARTEERKVLALLKGGKTSRLVLRIASEKMSVQGRLTLLSNGSPSRQK